ncbi:MAG: hypothetical protein KC503_19140 [Myxococcales bacterium]|nr:hypothetical protein [Myxococcales bacterium]
MIARALVALLCTLGCAACAQQDTVATFVGSSTDGASEGVGGGDLGDLGPLPDGVDPQSRLAYCRGKGPPVLVGDGSGATDVCSGKIAQQVFGHGLCACASVASNFDVRVDAFDSALGPYDPNAPLPGGAVAINDKLDLTGTTRIGGDLVVAGAQGVVAGASLFVGGALLDAGPLGTASSNVVVQGDARVGGNVELATLAVGGTLTVAPGQSVKVGGVEPSGLARAAVNVAARCGCGASQLVDVGGIVAAHAQSNHNADIALDAKRLADFKSDTTVDLPCGRFYLSAIQGSGARLTLRISGRVALFVGGNVTLDRDLDVELATPDAELDLFVSGTINAGGDVRLGDEAQPSRARLYIGGGGSFNVAGNATFVGNIYAPSVDAALSGGIEVYGALFVRRITTSGPVTIHYDHKVARASRDCIE